MSKSVKSIRELATAPINAFRRKTVSVAEWGGVEVQIREPSAGAWMRWQEILQPADAEQSQAEVASDIKLSNAEVVRRNLRADIVLFADVLLDENGKHVFTEDDHDVLLDIYGPVHSRLLRQALDLASTTAENVAEK